MVDVRRSIGAPGFCCHGTGRRGPDRGLKVHCDVSDQLGLSTASEVLEALLMTAAQSSVTF